MNCQIIELFKTLKLTFASGEYTSLSESHELLASLSLDDALLAMLTAEVDGRENRKRKFLLGNAGIPLPAELNDISYDENRGPDFAKRMSTIKSLSWTTTGDNLIILGPSGSGKSFIAAALGRESCRKGISTLFISASDLASELLERKAMGNAKYKSARKNYMRKALLIIDDFCLTAPNSDEQSVLFDLINDRYGKKSTIITSQKDKNCWIEDMGVTPIAEAIAERLCANSRTLTLGEGSRRRTYDEN